MSPARTRARPREITVLILALALLFDLDPGSLIELARRLVQG